MFIIHIYRSVRPSEAEGKGPHALGVCTGSSSPFENFSSATDFLGLSILGWLFAFPHGQFKEVETTCTVESFLRFLGNSCCQVLDGG